MSDCCSHLAESESSLHSASAEYPPLLTARQGPSHLIIDLLQFVDLRTLIERGMAQFRLILTRFPMYSATS